MIFRILFLLLFTFSKQCFSQNYSDSIKHKLTLTKDQNIQWYETLQKLSKSQQAIFISERVISDTNVFIKYGLPDGLKMNYDSIYKTKYEGCCKLIIAIQQIPNGNVYDFDFTESLMRVTRKQVADFNKIITSIQIDEITIDLNPSLALWGTRAVNGIILLKVSDKKSISLIKRYYK